MNKYNYGKVSGADATYKSVTVEINNEINGLEIGKTPAIVIFPDNELEQQQILLELTKKCGTKPILIGDTVPTGKKYKDIDDFISGENIPSNIIKKMKRLKKKH